MGTPIQEFFYRTEDEVEIHALSFGEKTGRPSLIFVPGMLGTCEHMQPLLGHFNDRLNISYSHRGCGKSQTPPAGKYNFKSRILDLAGLISQLELERVVLFGFSRGVSIVTAYALQYPSQVTGLVLVDCPPIYPKMSPAWTEKILANPRRTASEQAISCFQAESEELNLTEKLSQIACPVLLVRGDLAGSMLTLEEALRLKNLLPRSTEVVSLPQSGHDVSDLDVNYLKDKMQKFLQTV